MGILSDKIDAAIVDLDAQLSTLSSSTAVKTTELEAKRAIYRQAKALITPDLENAFAALKRLGVSL